MVHFPALPSPPYGFRWRYGGITRRGLPHSEIPGSKLVCSSPRLFSAYCVLHRLLAPRHSPYALSSLTIGIIDNFQSQTKTIARCNRRSAISNHQCLPTLTKHCCVCGSEKLPFAGYSVVKDQPGDFVPPDPLTRSLASRFRRAAPFARRTRSRSCAQALSSELARPGVLNYRTHSFSATAFIARSTEHCALSTETKWRIPGSNR